jgi:protein-L-isoaspartate(D-aspartate) O-methyltransferase
MTFDLHSARQTMVESQVRTQDVTDPLIQEAMRVVPRETVCGAAAHLAYADAEVPYAPGRWLLRPRDAAKLLQAVRGRPGERALAIRAPYLAKVLGAMGLSVDETDDVAAAAGSYDVIVCEGAVTKAPAAWLSALAPGGRLGVVERDGVVGRATIYLNSEDGPSPRIVFESGAPIIPELQPAPAFTF